VTVDGQPGQLPPLLLRGVARAVAFSGIQRIPYRAPRGESRRGVVSFRSGGRRLRRRVSRANPIPSRAEWKPLEAAGIEPGAIEELVEFTVIGSTVNSLRGLSISRAGMRPTF